MMALADLAKMPPDERKRVLRELTSGRPNGVAIEQEVRELERRYEMTSETMRTKVHSGTLDTADTARWLVLLSALGR